MLLPCDSVVDVKPQTERHKVWSDVIAKWQMLKPLQGGYVVKDVIASGRWKNHKVSYFNFSSEVLNSQNQPKLMLQLVV